MMTMTTKMWFAEIAAVVGRVRCVVVANANAKMVLQLVNAADVMDMERNDGENVVDVKLNRRHY